MLLLILGAGVHCWIIGLSEWQGGAAASPYVGFLVVLFLHREKIDDERVQAVKLRALSYGFIVGYCAVVFERVIRDRGLPNPVPGVSALDFMLIVLTAAFAVFHLLRWQDGRSAPTR